MRSHWASERAVTQEVLLGLTSAATLAKMPYTAVHMKPARGSTLKENDVQTGTPKRQENMAQVDRRVDASMEAFQEDCSLIATQSGKLYYWFGEYNGQQD